MNTCIVKIKINKIWVIHWLSSLRSLWDDSILFWNCKSRKGNLSSKLPRSRLLISTTQEAPEIGPWISLWFSSFHQLVECSPPFEFERCSSTIIHLYPCGKGHSKFEPWIPASQILQLQSGTSWENYSSLYLLTCLEMLERTSQAQNWWLLPPRI